MITADISISDNDCDLRYAALSYCWGSGSSLLTTSQNLASHLEELPVHQLPKTLADAVEVTRQLGLRFLWIDALCILQGARTDSKAYQDWQTESARMSLVYGNAFITIVAAGAPASQHGLRYAWPFPCRRDRLTASGFTKGGNPEAVGRLPTRGQGPDASINYRSRSWSERHFALLQRGVERVDETRTHFAEYSSSVQDDRPRREESVSLRQTSESQESSWWDERPILEAHHRSDDFHFPRQPSREIEFSGGDAGDKSDGTKQRRPKDSDGELGVNMGSEAISSRAWALQEWLLSRRLLVFATTGVHFICDERPLATTNVLYSLRLAPPGPRAWMSNKIGFINPWQRLVINFCARDLTDPADKLPAIAGLIEAYARVMGWPRTDCVAGVWRETLLKDLLWIRAGMESLPSTRLSGRRPGRAPSWSWASVDGNITYLELPKRWCRLRGTAALYKGIASAEVKICVGRSLASGDQASGQVMHANVWLRIRCRYLEIFVNMRDVKPDKNADGPFQEWIAVTYNFGFASLPKKFRARIVWDDPLELSQIDPGQAHPELLRYKLYFLGLVQLVKDGMTRWVGLVVRFNEQDYTYRRHGLFQCLWPDLFQKANEMDFQLV